jgi:fluoroacetyl-CoA thioesterase
VDALICSAKGCRAPACWALQWNNPKLHDPDRRKTWLACDDHRSSLAAFLDARGFLRETTTVPAPESRNLPVMELEPGLTATVELVVMESDTATALGSGDVPVLGTPRVLALVEEATVAAVRPKLDPSATTVGTHVELDHHAPTLVGATVIAEARLREIDGRRLTFDVVLREGSAVTAQGRVDRVVVDRARFLARATDKPA